MVGGLKVESRDDSDSWSRSDKFAAIAALNNQSFSGEGTRNRTRINIVLDTQSPSRQTKQNRYKSFDFSTEGFRHSANKTRNWAHVLSC